MPRRPYNRLPDLTYHAWLTSDPITSAWCDPELVLVWFGAWQEFRDAPLIQIVSQAAVGVDWERWARDFNYDY
jgi:hypothetical protein